MKPTVDSRTLTALLFEWTMIVATIAVCCNSDSALLWITGIIVLATRQHALLMLFHDAVHGLVARNPKLNDFIINLFAGVPFLLPVEVFRPLHISHHRQLGHERDPERTILFANQHWQYKALPLAKLIHQVVADLFLINAIKTILAWRRENRVIQINPATWIAVLLWSCMAIIVFVHSFSIALKISLLWFIPMLTITNLLQKLRSFAEHGGATAYTGVDHDWTYSWRVGWLGRLTIWPYNINRHREHHDTPFIPWYRLPEQSNSSTADLDSSTLLWHLLKR